MYLLEEQLVKAAVGDILYYSKKIPFIITDNALRFVYVNDVFCKQSACPRNELLGSSIGMFLNKQVFRQAFQEFFHFVRHRELRKERWRWKNKKGDLLESSIEVKRLEIGGKNYSATLLFDTTKEFIMEQELQREREIQSTIINGAQVGFWEADFANNTFETNEMFWKMLGYETPSENAEEAISFLMSNIHPEDLEQAPNPKIPIEDINKPTINTMFRVKTADGEWKWIQSYGKALTITEEGLPKNGVGIHIDVTDHYSAKQLVKETEEKYRLLSESIPSLIWTADAEGYLNNMNRFGLKYFGITNPSFKEWRWKNYIHPEEIEEADKNWYLALESGTALNINNRMKGATGNYKWFQVLIFPQKLENGEIISWTGIATDIDERVNIEQSLKKTNERLLAFINASPTAIYSLDADFKIRDLWNPAAERIFGWTRKEVIDEHPPFLPKEAFELMDEHFKIQKRKNAQRKSRRINKFGDEIVLDIQAGSIFDEKGNLEELIFTLMDITEIELNREQLKESLKEKETLLQEIHHRVKNNLTIIVSLLQLQVYQTKDEMVRFRLTQAQNRILSIAMVHELLYETDEFSKVDLVTYYDKLIKTIKSNMLMERNHIKHVIHIDISSLNINQAIPLGLLINELVTNTLKYAFPTESEKNEFTLSIHELDGRLKVTYSDNGVGFDMSEKSFKAGLGFKIMDSLLNQLEAEYIIDSNNGYRIDFSFSDQSLITQD